MRFIAADILDSTTPTAQFIKYEEIRESIKAASNKYEVQNDIRTLEIIEVLKRDDIAFLWARKTDRTTTLFIALRVSKWFDSWLWFCPTESQIQYLKIVLPGTYKNVDDLNAKIRTRSQPSPCGEEGGEITTDSRA